MLDLQGHPRLSMPCFRPVGRRYCTRVPCPCHSPQRVLFKIDQPCRDVVEQNLINKRRDAAVAPARARVVRHHLVFGGSARSTEQPANSGAAVAPRSAARSTVAVIAWYILSGPSYGQNGCGAAVRMSQRREPRVSGWGPTREAGPCTACAAPCVATRSRSLTAARDCCCCCCCCLNPPEPRSLCTGTSR